MSKRVLGYSYSIIILRHFRDHFILFVFVPTSTSKQIPKPNSEYYGPFFVQTF